MTTVVAVIFGVFAIGLIVLLIYKSTLTMHEDEQLFLDDASSHMHAEQTELLAKVTPAYRPSPRKLDHLKCEFSQTQERRTSMKGTRHSEEQIIAILKQGRQD